MHLYISHVSILMIIALTGCQGTLNRDDHVAGEDEDADAGHSPPQLDIDSPPQDIGFLDAGLPDVGFVDAQRDVDLGGCASVEQEFLKEVYAPVLVPLCQSCHNPLGSASFASFKLALPELDPTHIDTNLSMLRGVAAQEIDGVSKLLVKPTGGAGHAGGVVIEEGSEQYTRLARFVDHVKGSEFCAPQPLPNIDATLIALTPLEHARRISLALGGRALTLTEIDGLKSGDLTITDFTNRILSEPAFIDIFEEGFNDTFHLLGGIDLNSGYLDDRDYPNKDWHKGHATEEEQQRHGEAVARGMKRAPLELMRHLVANDLPFTSVVDADYTMVNYATAKVYGVDDQTSFDGSEDPESFQPARLRRALADVDFPHAGILTTSLFLRIYPTTDTNRNRGRARVAYQFFLNTNVLEVAAEGGGDSQDVAELENPIRDAEQCRQCHYIVDPMAGAFQNFDDRAQWRPRGGGWYDDTFTTSFISSTGEVRDMPGEDTHRALQWFGDQIASDARFPSAMVTHVYLAVMGVPPLTFPKAADQAGYLGKLHAYTLQQQWFRDVEQQFIDSNYNLKSIYRAVVLSRYFATRRVDLDPDGMDADTWATYEGITRSVILTPEQLQRKIVAVFGEPWTLYDFDAILNRHPLPYNSLLGAIDSSILKTRPREMTTFIGAATRIMAGEVSCKLAMPDFKLPAEQRRLFPFVEPDFDEAAHAAQIRENIAHLHWVILGEVHTAESDDVKELFTLFSAIRQQGLADVEDNPSYRGLRSACGGQDDPTYSLHAWNAVVMYMLEDWAFLHQF